MNNQILLRVEDLRVQFRTRAGIVQAVNGVSFDIHRGEAVAVVGESGSGKSVTALSILRLVPEPGRIVGGRILVHPPDGPPQDVTGMDADQIRRLRGSQIALISQDPMTSLNPVFRVGTQIKEAMTAHSRFSARQAAERVVPLLRKVRIPEPERRAKAYPHQFSGGMRQRAMIAMGISNDPSLLIADEPTTALDVTVQAQVIALLRELNRDAGTAVMLITHDLAVVAALCTRVIVMYAGQIVEEGATREVFRNPQHPYTWSLLRSTPRVDRHYSKEDRLASITGTPPDMSAPPPGCPFHPRCPFRQPQCLSDNPPLTSAGTARIARCWVRMDNVPERERVQQP